MKISASRIASLLTIGENLNIEFKKASDGPKADTFESVCAFLNKAGGDLLLGVDDDGTVVGLPPKAEVDKALPSDTTTETTIETNRETSPETSPEISLEISSETLLNGLSKGARQVVALIKSDDKITTQSMADRINVSKRMVMNYVKELASVGLRHEGPTKKGRWVLDVVATKNDASKAKKGKSAK